MKEYSEFEKGELRKAFERLIESGEDCLVWEVLQLENLRPSRRTFRISVKELTD